MGTTPTRVRVTSSRARDHVVTISFGPGDDLAVGHRNQQYPDFIWCATEDGRHGWVPERCVQMIDEREAVALCEYDAAQLTVSKDEILEVLEAAGSWLRCRNAGGVEGWVPESIIEAIPEPPKPRGFPMPMRVTESRVSDHIDDIRFLAGDAIVVGHRNQVYPEFVWCATEDGRAGWGPESYLEMVGESEAVALRDYAAGKLTVVKGEALEAVEQIGNWLLCRNTTGREGWVRVDYLEPVDE
jgi:hypothetical protein